MMVDTDSWIVSGFVAREKSLMAAQLSRTVAPAHDSAAGGEGRGRGWGKGTGFRGDTLAAAAQHGALAPLPAQRRVPAGAALVWFG